MTPRSSCSSVASRRAAALLLGLLLVPGAAIAGDAQNVDSGRAAARAILIFGDPRACGIALLRARCMADIEAYLNGRGDGDFGHVPKIGAKPVTGLRAFLTDGDRDAFPFALSWINSIQSTEAMWGSDARAAALFDAGVVDVMLPTAMGGPPIENLTLGAVVDLAKHVARIPAGALPVDVGPIRGENRAPAGFYRLPPGASKFAHDLVAAVDANAPPAPLATITASNDAAGDAALGVAAGTVAQLADARVWLVQADAQRFVDDYVARLGKLAPERTSEIADLRAKLRGSPPAAYDHGAIQAAHTQLLGAVVAGMGERGSRIAVAMAAAQLPYNAALWRQPQTAAALLGSLTATSALDGIPGFARARAEAATTAPADWGAQYRLGVRLVDIIQKANGP